MSVLGIFIAALGGNFSHFKTLKISTRPQRVLTTAVVLGAAILLCSAIHLVVDTMVDIVEMIEGSVSSDGFVEMQQNRARAEEERKLKAEQLRQLAHTDLPAALLGLLHSRVGFTTKEVGDKLRGTTGLPIENIDVVHALSKLVNEGKATKIMDSERMIRYMARARRRPSSTRTPSISVKCPQFSWSGRT